MSLPDKSLADVEGEGRDYSAAYCIEQGDEACFRSEHKLALRWYTRAIDKEPKSVKPWLAMLRVLLFKGDLSETAAWAHRGMTLFPENLDLLALSSVQLARRGMTSKAQVDSHDAMERSPNSPIARICRGEVLMIMGDRHYDNLLREAMDLVPPADWKTPLTIGMMLREAGRFGTALDYLKEAQKRNPESAAVWMQLALCHADKGQVLPTQNAIMRVRDLCAENDPLLLRAHHINCGTWWRWLARLWS